MTAACLLAAFLFVPSSSLRWTLAGSGFCAAMMRFEAMKRLRLSLMPAVLGLLLWVSPAGAADFTTYRDFRFGMSLDAAVKLAGAQATDIRVVQRRPALIQELEWRPGYAYGAAARVDPVREGVLSFYNGELFEIVTTYDGARIEGLTETDMIEAISQTYGPAARPETRIRYRSNYGNSTAVLAQWQKEEHSNALVQTGDRASFALILSQKRLAGLARTSMVEAARLDALEAPQRAIDRRKQQDADTQLALDKLRAANRPNFRP